MSAVCVVVGEGLLALETARALVAAGFQVSSVLTQDAALTSFCEEHGITRHTSRSGLVAAIMEGGGTCCSRSIILDNARASARRGAPRCIKFKTVCRATGHVRNSWVDQREQQHGISWP